MMELKTRIRKKNDLFWVEEGYDLKFLGIRYKTVWNKCSGFFESWREADDWLIKDRQGVAVKPVVLSYGFYARFENGRTDNRRRIGNKQPVSWWIESRGHEFSMKFKDDCVLDVDIDRVKKINFYDTFDNHVASHLVSEFTSVPFLNEGDTVRLYKDN